MPTITWYLNRLRQMSPMEISLRVGRGLRNGAEHYGIHAYREVPPPQFHSPGAPFIFVPSLTDASPYTAAANALLEGRMDLFVLRDARCGFPPDWNRDLKSGTSAPLSFGKTLNYRDPELVGDIKYLWEINRHLQMVTLAQAYRLDSDPCYLEGIGTLLQSWLEQCPYLRGPNWTSPLESGIRLINWSLVWQLIGGNDSPLFEGAAGEALLKSWLASIYRHLLFVRGALSRYSSANNHLIGEAAGLFIATCTWPYWDKCDRLQKTAFEILVQEAQAQNYPDGVNKEQALSYQQFVLDFLLFSAHAGRANNIDFPQDYWKILESMIEFIASIMDREGNLPMIGDADDGYVTNLSQEKDFCPFRSLMATGAILFDRRDFKKKAGRLDEKTLWLFGDSAREKFELLPDAEPSMKRSFPQGGYYILGCHFDEPGEIRVLADAGPLGYRSLAAHGHADALSFVLTVGGREILIDPGTYAYHTQKKWRDYFRGTSAHNTVQVDGENQSVIGGNFMWLHKADAECLYWRSDDDEDHFIGTHNGYLRLPDPVRHRREIRLDKKLRKIAISDQLECRGTHEIERFWHFSETCRVTLVDGKVLIACDGQEVLLTSLTEGTEILLRRGEFAPPCGWISRRYDVKEPITTVVFRDNIDGSNLLATEIDCSLSACS